MNESRETLEDRLQNYEAQLGGLKSFVKELNHHADKHETPREHLEEDLLEAEHNIKFYEEGIEHVKAQLAKLGDAPQPGRPGAGGGGIGPVLKSKKGIGAIVVGLAAAALVALGLKKSRRGGGKSDELND